MSEQNMSFEGWCIVELFGHNQIAGYVSEQIIGGSTFIRVDVPATSKAEQFTKLFGGGAIYAITPTTETIARAVADHLTVLPVAPWVFPNVDREPKLVASGSGDNQIIMVDDEDEDENLGLVRDARTPY